MIIVYLILYMGKLFIDFNNFDVYFQRYNIMVWGCGYIYVYWWFFF